MSEPDLPVDRVLVTSSQAVPPPVRRLFVSGKVQGVGFRWFVRERARRLGVSGWVRNERDGRVQIVVGGPASLVSRFVNELNIGPPNSKIDSVVEADAATADGVAAQEGALPYPFEIRR